MTNHRTRGRQRIILLLNDMGGGIMNIEKGDVSPTLRRETHGHEPIIVLENDGANDNEMLRCETGRRKGI